MHAPQGNFKRNLYIYLLSSLYFKIQLSFKYILANLYLLKCYKLLIIKNSPLYVVLGSRQKVGVIFSASFYSRKLFYLGMISPSIESHSRALRHLLNFYYNHVLLFHHTFLSFLKQISISYSPSTQTLVHIIRNLNQDMKNNILIPEMLYTSLS